MKTTQTLGRRLIAGAGVAALGLAGIATAAFADLAGGVGPDQPDAPEYGSLSIHKLVGSEGERGDGTVQDITGDPLQDAEFTIWQLGVEEGGTCEALDLSEVDAWDSMPTGAAPETLAEVEEEFCIVGSPQVDRTDADGFLEFDRLDLGVYYVQETDAPPNIVSRTAPFYVSVPLPHEDGSWIYDVHAYPKNQELEAPEKEINPDEEQEELGFTVGSVVEWTITQTVPALNDGETYETASIWDVLPAGELEYKETLSVKLNDEVLVEGLDYEIDDAGVEWKFIDGGLGRLEAGQQIEVIFSTTVLKVTETGEIANPGSDGSEPGYGSEFNGGKTPGGPTPYTYWGALKVSKVDENDAPLAGAEFEVYPADSAGVCADDPVGNIVSAGTSGDDGVVLWTPNEPDNSSPLGLFVANSNDGPLDDPSKDYCLYETKAPAGYTGFDGGMDLQIPAGDTLTVDVNDITVLNVPKDGPDLPLTGAQGTLAMTVGGLLLVALGAGVYFVAQRKNAHRA